MYGCISYMRFVEYLRSTAPGDDRPHLRVHDFHPERIISHKDLILPFEASPHSMIMLRQDTLIVYDHQVRNLLFGRLYLAGSANAHDVFLQRRKFHYYTF